MKKLFLMALLLPAMTFVQAQTVDFSLLPRSTKSDTISKKILEPAQYMVTYDYRFVRDAKKPAEKRESLTVLQVGERYNRFVDYNQLRYDSIFDVTSKKQLSWNETGQKLFAFRRNARFQQSIVVDKKNNKETVQETFLAQKIQYDEDCPVLKWDLLDGDSVIAGYHCSKAKTRFAGRDYTAWYSADVNMPYGPYKFGGLPGLIFKVTDTAGNFEFTLCGLEKVAQPTPIYIWADKKTLKTSREKARKIYRNYCADPSLAFGGMDGITSSNGVPFTVKSKPYNPIELE